MKDTEILKEIQTFHKELRDYNDSLKSEFHKAYTDVLLKIEKLPTQEDFKRNKSRSLAFLKIQILWNFERK